MKKSLLIAFALTAVAASQAQKQTAYAITSVEKGSSKWTEVRLIDLASGEAVQTVYQNAAAADVLSARSGKAIVLTDAKAKTAAAKPFATNSAALAFDAKHNRLYYTPMGINELRYIDLKAKGSKVYFFDGEPFGVVKGNGDVAAQITRMVIAADGNGYALSNDGNHLLRFTTGKKPVITDLGLLTDDLTNGRHSIHGTSSYGGDMIADKDGFLWLVTAGNAVFKIPIDSKTASYVGRIKGLPRGYSTNGAVAEGGPKILVSSSRSTEGYYRFDLNTLQATKVSAAATVFNASDLANAVLASERSEEDKQEETPVTPLLKKTLPAVATRNAIAVFPNPVTTGFFKLSFADQAPGRYTVQLLDVSGKIISTRPYNLVNKLQVEEFRLPQKLAAGNYLVRVQGDNSQAPVVQQLVVQQ